MSSSPACFAGLNPGRAVLRAPTPLQWTALGALAIPLWALWPSLAIRTASVPPLESLTLMFACGFVSFSTLHALVPEEQAPREGAWRAWLPPLVYAAALSGGDLCFLLATLRLPAAQANLLSYLWPVMIVVMGAAVGIFRLRLRQLAGLALGFCGALILFWDGHISLSFPGIALALLSGALWAAYCVFRLLWKAPVGNLLARGCGISVLLCAALHFIFEPTVLPDARAVTAMAISGFVALGLGNFLWDQGFRRGDSHLLAVMAYATPLCSALLLTVLGAALLTWNLLLGALVIVAAGLLSRTAATAGAEEPGAPG
jgi:drug/metabolite transporter (DMT)-like permease